MYQNLAISEDVNFAMVTNVILMTESPHIILILQVCYWAELISLDDPALIFIKYYSGA